MTPGSDSSAEFLKGSVTDEHLSQTKTNGLAGNPVAIWTAVTSVPCAVGTIIIVVYSAVKCKKPSTRR